MPALNYSAQHILLPSNKTTLRFVETISLTGAVCVLLAAIALAIFGKTLFNAPTILALFASTISVFFFRIQKGSPTLRMNNVFIPLLVCGLLVLLVGSATLLTFNGIRLDLFQHISGVNENAGIFFLLIGLSLICNAIKIPHRYHYAQLLVFIALSLGLFGFLENFYQLLLSGTLNSVKQTDLISSLLFFILCQSLILAKPERGFVGIFTTDSQSSQLARQTLVYFALLPPILGFVILGAEKAGILDIYGRLALLVILFMLVSVIITWVNVKLLYPSEVEHYLTREALRVNNITLELNSKDLSTKVIELEEAKQEITRKLNNQQTLQDIVGSLG